MSMDLRDGVAVVTGAASGIGRATAAALATRGCHLALVDRDGAGLENTARHAEAMGVRVSRHVADLGDAAAVERIHGQVLARHPEVTVLVNNAGVGLVGRFDQLTMEEIRWLMEVNFFAVVGLTRAFLPHLRSRRRAHIVNVSSVFGLIAPAEQSAYVASKFAVRGFSESLRHELEGTPIGITVVHPGGVRTSIATSSRVAAAVDPDAAKRSVDRFTRQGLRFPAERAGELIARAIERRQKRLLIGADARALELVQRAMPVGYWGLLRRAFQRFSLGSS